MDKDGFLDELSYLDGRAEGIAELLEQENRKLDNERLRYWQAYCEGLKYATSYLRNWFACVGGDDDRL